MSMEFSYNLKADQETYSLYSPEKIFVWVERADPSESAINKDIITIFSHDFDFHSE